MLVTNLDVESVTHLEPANFWIGPSAVISLLKRAFGHVVSKSLIEFSDRFDPFGCQVRSVHAVGLGP